MTPARRYAVAGCLRTSVAPARRPFGAGRCGGCGHLRGGASRRTQAGGSRVLEDYVSPSVRTPWERPAGGAGSESPGRSHPISPGRRARAVGRGCADRTTAGGAAGDLPRASVAPAGSCARDAVRLSRAGPRSWEDTGAETGRPCRAAGAPQPLDDARRTTHPARRTTHDAQRPRPSSRPARATSPRDESHSPRCTVPLGARCCSCGVRCPPCVADVRHVATAFPVRRRARAVPAGRRSVDSAVTRRAPSTTPADRQAWTGTAKRPHGCGPQGASLVDRPHAPEPDLAPSRPEVGQLSDGATIAPSSPSDAVQRARVARRSSLVARREVAFLLLTRRSTPCASGERGSSRCDGAGVRPGTCIGASR